MLTIEEAKRIMAAGLGRAELEFAASITAPLYWVSRAAGGDGPIIRNGSCFFLDAGAGLFGVTAAHVVRGMQAVHQKGEAVSCQLGHDLRFDLDGKNALIAIDDGIDIATFRITETEVHSIRKTVLTGYQKKWPPSPPQLDRGVTYAGFPGASRLWLSKNEISFGICAAGGVASSVSELDVSSLIERQHLMDVMQTGELPSNFDFRGISGGPMLTITEHNGLRSWQLAGVIYEGPNTSDDAEQTIAGLDIIRARRADFIHTDGTINVRRWKELGPFLTR